MALAPDQTAAIAATARSGLTLDLLVGPAGAGKTTALRALHRAWTAAHGRDSVIGLARPLPPPRCSATASEYGPRTRRSSSGSTAKAGGISSQGSSS
nr:AAA family ATPase [uncultured Microbacterium sp.]